MSQSTPKPRGWQSDPARNRRQLRGWVGGKLIGGGSFPELVQKVPAQSAFEPRVRRPMRAPPYRP